MKKLIFLLFFVFYIYGDKIHSSINVNESGVYFVINFGTVYHPDRRQTDSTPFITADNSVINPNKINQLKWVALSRDLIMCSIRDSLYKNPIHWQGKFNFGEKIEVISGRKITITGDTINDLDIQGIWTIHDCMNKRYTSRIDFLQSKTGFYGTWVDIVIRKVDKIY